MRVTLFGRRAFEGRDIGHHRLELRRRQDVAAERGQSFEHFFIGPAHRLWRVERLGDFDEGEALEIFQQEAGIGEMAPFGLGIEAGENQHLLLELQLVLQRQRVIGLLKPVIHLQNLIDEIHLLFQERLFQPLEHHLVPALVIALRQNLDGPLEFGRLERIERGENARLIDENTPFDVGEIEHMRSPRDPSAACGISTGLWSGSR